MRNIKFLLSYLNSFELGPTPAVSFQYVKQRCQPPFELIDDAKLDTKFYRQMAFKMAVSDILRLSLEFSVFP